MKKRVAIAFLLLVLFTTITSEQKISLINFNLKKIEIENNFLLEEKEIKKLLIPIYNKNLILLNHKDIQKAIMENNFIESFTVQKKYPNTLRIKIFEKKPIAILINKKKKII